MKSAGTVVESIESGDAHIDFKDVNYTSLPNGNKNKDDEYTRSYSVESIHDLKGLKETT